jgi:hypothetical protein
VKAAGRRFHFVHQSDLAADIYAHDGHRVGTIAALRSGRTLFYPAPCGQFTAEELAQLLRLMAERTIDREYGS